jgi:hypothetical protein
MCTMLCALYFFLLNFAPCVSMLLPFIYRVSDDVKLIDTLPLFMGGHYKSKENGTIIILPSLSIEVVMDI